MLLGWCPKIISSHSYKIKFIHDKELFSSCLNFVAAPIGYSDIVLGCSYNIFDCIFAQVWLQLSQVYGRLNNRNKVTAKRFAYCSLVYVYLCIFNVVFPLLSDYDAIIYTRTHLLHTVQQPLIYTYLVFFFTYFFQVSSYLISFSCYKENFTTF